MFYLRVRLWLFLLSSSWSSSSWPTCTGLRSSVQCCFPATTAELSFLGRAARSCSSCGGRCCAPKSASWQQHLKGQNQAHRTAADDSAVPTAAGGRKRTRKPTNKPNGHEPHLRVRWSVTISEQGSHISSWLHSLAKHIAEQYCDVISIV